MALPFGAKAMLKRRQFIRKRKLDEVGLPLPLAPLLQTSVEL